MFECPPTKKTVTPQHVQVEFDSHHVSASLQNHYTSSSLRLKNKTLLKNEKSNKADMICTSGSGCDKRDHARRQERLHTKHSSWPRVNQRHLKQIQRDTISVHWGARRRSGATHQLRHPIGGVLATPFSPASADTASEITTQVLAVNLEMIFVLPIRSRGHAAATAGEDV